jgi:hypothetical protein
VALSQLTLNTEEPTIRLLPQIGRLHELKMTVILTGYGVVMHAMEAKTGC